MSLPPPGSESVVRSGEWEPEHTVRTSEFANHPSLASAPVLCEARSSPAGPRSLSLSQSPSSSVSATPTSTLAERLLGVPTTMGHLHGHYWNPAHPLLWSDAGEGFGPPPAPPTPASGEEQRILVTRYYLPPGIIPGDGHSARLLIEKALRPPQVVAAASERKYGAHFKSDFFVRSRWYYPGCKRSNV